MAGVPGFPESLDTARMRLHAPRVEDAQAMVEAIDESFAELRRWLDWASAVPSLEEEQRVVADRRALHQRGEEATYLMRERARGELLGCCGLPRPDWPRRRFEIGYWVRSSRAGCGYVSEAAARLARLGFEQLGARRMEIRTSALNRRSAAVARRVGFRLGQTLEADGRHPDGSPRDTIVFVLHDPADIAASFAAPAGSARGRAGQGDHR